MSWITRLQQRLSDRLHAGDDAIARQAGWTTTQDTGPVRVRGPGVPRPPVRPAAGRGEQDGPAHRGTPWHAAPARPAHPTTVGGGSPVRQAADGKEADSWLTTTH